MVPSFMVGDRDGMFSTVPTSEAAGVGAAAAGAAVAGAAAAGAGADGAPAEDGIWMALMSSPSSAKMAINSPICTFLASLEKERKS